MLHNQQAFTIKKQAKKFKIRNNDLKAIII